MIPDATGANEEMERRTLRLLCSILIQPVTRLELVRLLDSSLFTDTLNRVVFEEIAAMGELPSRDVRALLPARITNRGFPDFDLKEFLGADRVSESEIENLFASVLRMIEMRHGETGGGGELPA